MPNTSRNRRFMRKRVNNLKCVCHEHCVINSSCILVPQRTKDDDVKDGDFEDLQHEGDDAKRGNDEVERVPPRHEVAAHTETKQFEDSLQSVNCSQGEETM